MSATIKYVQYGRGVDYGGIIKDKARGMSVEGVAAKNRASKSTVMEILATAVVLVNRAKPFASRPTYRLFWTEHPKRVRVLVKGVNLLPPARTIERRLVELARQAKTTCPRCGYHTNPKGCCRKACKDYSGYPF